MLILILGVALWWAAHLFRRIAPDARAAMGGQGRAYVALGLLLSVVLMVIGYRGAGGPYWWGATGATKGINNLLVLVAVYLFAASGMKTRAARVIRHPMLTGFALWAFAHLLPNGDLPSFVLFGGLLAWALVEMAVLNRAQPGRTPPPPAPMRKEVMAIVGTLVVYAVMALVHIWLGYNPFGG
ncbi:MAG: NnrU family protein [Paracoccus sp. (in: a-proteobacteria)]|uniref:NnrU family protein n=1 Tax=Paracoccus sp. TaxID=267 RepID=UPI0026DEDAEC|nr:NnrU family protein [Paracoccus sp. (in: a-proteobacteria)]MDO5613934.1 NnrU family protein [Paracoccus sp. (in: a-proteobacteria)]